MVAGSRSDSTQSNLEIWKSDSAVAQWVASTDERERHRGWARQMMAELLPFERSDAFSFVDLGAGTGAAASVVLEHYPAAARRLLPR